MSIDARCDSNGSSGFEFMYTITVEGLMPIENSFCIVSYFAVVCYLWIFPVGSLGPNIILNRVLPAYVVV